MDVHVHKFQSITIKGIPLKQSFGKYVKTVPKVVGDEKYSTYSEKIVGRPHR